MADMTGTGGCELCGEGPEQVLWRDGFCRVVLVDDPDYPGFCRVILRAHVREMTDLGTADRARLMNVVFATEAALRETAKPDKINLASLGNAVPHIHWHVIPRWRDDRHFPKPVWASAERPGNDRAAVPVDALTAVLRRKITEGSP